MTRVTSILILLAMGLITNQLPLVWMSYNTVQSDYAQEQCVNKGTSCHGSCTMKRDFVQSSSTSTSSDGVPVNVIESVNEIAPYLPLASETLEPTSSDVAVTLKACDAGVVDNLAPQPPVPPPEV